jgi:tetratricopeptide (TPR) repeat protein
MQKRLSFLILFFVIAIPSMAQYSFEQLMSFGLRSDEKGDYATAIVSLDQAVEMKPNEDIAWLTRGVVRVHMKDFGSAVVDFNKAILLNPQRNQTYLYRYIAYKETENFQFAFSDINRYLDQETEDTFAHLQRMDLSMLLSEFETFQKDFNWLYAKMGDALVTEFGQQQLQYFEKVKQMKVYAQILGETFEKFPHNKWLKQQYIMSLFQSEQYSLCLSLVEEELRLNPNQVSLQKYQGDALFYLNRIDEAAAVYAVLLKSTPNDADLLADYGHCLLQQEKWVEADEWLSKSIKSKNSAPAYAYLGRGIARYNQGKVGLACVDWERSYQLGEKAAKKWLDAHCK